MKKIVLSLAGVLAATAFAPEAAAIPAFARQTGMACSACHFQHYPVLNSFGMAFKASGYTMMGAQGKVEGEHLSIPDTLNMSMLIKARYQKTNGTDAAGTVSGTTTNGGQWQIPDELSLFVGGRVAENIGTLLEINLAGQAIAGVSAAQFKMPVGFDMGAAKLSVVPFTSDTAGPAYGYELGSTGLVRALRWSEDRGAITAAGTAGLHSGVTGLAIVAKNDMGYINLTRYSPNFTASGAAAVQLRSNWLRIAATPTVADWNMHIGLGNASGSNYTAGAATLATMTCTGTLIATCTPVAAVAATQTQVDTRATILDFQGQTQLGGNDFSLYASYGSAPASTAARANFNNAAFNRRSAFTIGADYSVIQHTAHIGAAIKRSDNGAGAAGAALNNKDNQIMVQGIYDLAQNVAVSVTHTRYSGSAYTVVPATGTALTTFLLEAAW